MSTVVRIVHIGAAVGGLILVGVAVVFVLAVLEWRRARVEAKGRPR